MIAHRLVVLAGSAEVWLGPFRVSPADVSDTLQQAQAGNIGAGQALLEQPAGDFLDAFEILSCQQLLDLHEIDAGAFRLRIIIEEELNRLAGPLCDQFEGGQGRVALAGLDEKNGGTADIALGDIGQAHARRSAGVTN